MKAITIINNKNMKSFQIGKFCSNWYFEVRSEKMFGHAVEIKMNGYHLRWYIEQKFFFLRNEKKMLAEA